MSSAKRLREMVSGKTKSGARERVAVIAADMRESCVLESIYAPLPALVVAGLEREGFRVFPHEEHHYNCWSSPRTCVCTVVSAKHVVLNSHATLANSVALAVDEFTQRTSSLSADEIIAFMIRHLMVERKFASLLSEDTIEKLRAEGFTTSVTVKESLRCTHAFASLDSCQRCAPQVCTTVSARNPSDAD